MALSVTVTITGDKAVMAKLRKLGDGIRVMPEAMQAIGKSAAEYYRTVGITDQGAPYGEKWQALSQQYQAYKEKKFPGRPIMVATGTLKDSFTAKATTNSVTIGNTAQYYKYHQSSAARTKMPRRQIAGINGDIKMMVKEIIRADIKAKIMAA